MLSFVNVMAEVEAVKEVSTIVCGTNKSMLAIPDLSKAKAIHLSFDIYFLHVCSIPCQHLMSVQRYIVMPL